MDVLSFRTEIRRLIELRQEGEYWDFKKEWYQNKSDLLNDIIMVISKRLIAKNREAYEVLAK